MMTMTENVVDFPDVVELEEKRGCSYYFKKFDEEILRPIIIYKYFRQKYQPEINFDKLLRETDNHCQEIGLHNYYNRATTKSALGNSHLRISSNSNMHMLQGSAFVRNDIRHLDTSQKSATLGMNLANSHTF